MAKRLIPFNMLPASWGLRGRAYDEARAHYELDGIDLELRLAEINLSGNDLLKAQAEIQYRYGLIDQFEWMRQTILIETEGDDQTVELIKLDIEFGRKTKREGEKEIAALLKEPWVSIVDEGLDTTQGPSGFYFEFDWNEHWIELLRANGYEGSSDEDLMDKWFNDVCREQIMQNAPIPFNSSVVYD